MDYFLWPCIGVVVCRLRREKQVVDTCMQALWQVHSGYDVGLTGTLSQVPCGA